MQALPVIALLGAEGIKLLAALAVVATLDLAVLSRKELSRSSTIMELFFSYIQAS